MRKLLKSIVIAGLISSPLMVFATEYSGKLIRGGAAEMVVVDDGFNLTPGDAVIYNAVAATAEDPYRGRAYAMTEDEGTKLGKILDLAHQHKGSTDVKLVVIKNKQDKKIAPAVIMASSKKLGDKGCLVRFSSQGDRDKFIVDAKKFGYDNEVLVGDQSTDALIVCFDMLGGSSGKGL